MSDLFWLSDAQMARLEPFCAFRASRTAIPTARGQSFRGARTKFARDAERLI